MSRNDIHNFLDLPEANIPRSKFSMPCNVKFTGNAGRLIPFYVAEVLPGDTFNVKTSLVCRLQTLIHPLMDNMYLDTYYFFVPNRLVWDNWQHFCGEANKAWVSDREYTIPTITVPTAYSYADRSFKDSIIDYMGVGVNKVADQIDVNKRGMIEINALPIRAYNKIYDDWFRDENLIDPINLDTGDNNLSWSSVDSLVDPTQSLLLEARKSTYGGVTYKAPKLHDYFTSALPEAQRGNPATLVTGFGGSATVKTSGSILFTDPTYAAHFDAVGSSAKTSFTAQSAKAASGSGNVSVVGRSNSDNPVTSNAYYPDNLYADMSGVNLGITINDLRMAFQVQKWMEKSARGGARYIELIKSMFGVTSPDARLQRSEYLGGHRVPINIHQIVNTTETVDTPLGNTGAMSVTSDVHNDFIHSFVEHGFVIGICTVRYKHSYPQGLDRMWNRRTKFDFYWPCFANIGEQPIKNKEIYLYPLQEYVSDGDLVFGYQEAWSDYRFKPNRVMGEMRPGIQNSLASWNLADYYASQPILSKDWIEEDIAPIDRAIAVTSSAADQFLFDVLIDNEATRPMPLYSIPGLVDHF